MTLQPELSSILYPLFVHGYLDLIKKGQLLYGTQGEMLDVNYLPFCCELKHESEI